MKEEIKEAFKDTAIKVSYILALALGGLCGYSAFRFGQWLGSFLIVR